MPTIRERNGKWQAIVRIKRNGVLAHQEARTFDTAKLAQAWGDKVERTIARDGLPARLRGAATLAELIGKYRTAREEIRPLGRSILADLDLIERDLGANRLDALTSETFATFARTRRAVCGPVTVLHNLSVARSVLEAAKPMFGMDVTGAPVTEAIKVLSTTGHVSKSEERTRRATPDELAALDADFKRLASHPSTIIPMDTIVQLAVALPRRLGELCDMKWVDYSGRTVTLRDTKHPRVTRTETVPVPRSAREILDNLPKIGARVLPYKTESVSAAFQRATARLNIVDLHFHDLRHEGICRLFEAGLSIPEVSMISGHLSWTSLKRYTHLQPEQVLEKLDARP